MSIHTYSIRDINLDFEINDISSSDEYDYFIKFNMLINLSFNGLSFVTVPINLNGRFLLNVLDFFQSGTKKNLRNVFLNSDKETNSLDNNLLITWNSKKRLMKAIYRDPNDDHYFSLSMTFCSEECKEISFKIKKQLDIMLQLRKK